MPCISQIISAPPVWYTEHTSGNGDVPGRELTFIKGLRGRGVVAIRHKNMFYSFDEEKKEGEGETKE